METVSDRCGPGISQLDPVELNPPAAFHVSLQPGEVASGGEADKDAEA
jgi:hypothetical protein